MPNNSASPFPSHYRSLLCACVLLLGVAGCTSANQQSLGVGTSVQPAAQPVDTEATPQDATVTALASPATENPAIAAATPSDAVNPQAPTANTIANVQFLPVTGAPASKVNQLARSISGKARSNNLGIVTSSTGAKYRIQGYFSALNAGTNTTVTFYWDVLDASGRRLYRINGFEKISGVSTDPWARVNASALDRIAQRTVNDLSAWIRRKRG
ncbi:MAG: hypothetical protein AAF468_06735 [Pseudomonadota bacterium]